MKGFILALLLGFSFSFGFAQAPEDDVGFDDLQTELAICIDCEATITGVSMEAPTFYLTNSSIMSATDISIVETLQTNEAQAKAIKRRTDHKPTDKASTKLNRYLKKQSRKIASESKVISRRISQIRRMC